MTHPRAFTLIRSALVPATRNGLRKGRPKPSIETCITSPSCKLMPSLKLKAVRPEEMNVNISRAAMGFILEMMVFDVRQAVTHLSLAAAEGFRPEQVAGALDLHLDRHGLEVRVYDKFRSERAGAKLGRRQVEIVRLLEYVV